LISLEDRASGGVDATPRFVGTYPQQEPAGAATRHAAEEILEHNSKDLAPNLGIC